MLNQYKAEPSTGLTDRPTNQQVLRSLCFIKYPSTIYVQLVYKARDFNIVAWKNQSLAKKCKIPMSNQKNLSNLKYVYDFLTCVGPNCGKTVWPPEVTSLR